MESTRAQAPTAAGGERLLGAGRAAIVFLSSDASGRATARKVFVSGVLTRAVQHLFLGARNPYSWSEHAVQAAILRRRVLAPLVRHWFGEQLRVAEGWSVDWNAEHGAWQLHTEYVHGRSPALHHALDHSGRDEVRELAGEILPRLQEHLRAAGFDGQVWQAGLGNPVALANFLLEDLPGGGRRWAWIDLESGVPALFPAHVPSLWRFYIPCAWRYRRPLFDDVDVARLESWLRERRGELVASLGPATVEGLERDAAALGYRQGAWRAMSFLERSVRAQVPTGRVREEDVERLCARPILWYGRESARIAGELARLGLRRLARWTKVLVRFPWWRALCIFAGFLVSQKRRQHLAQACVERRVDSWLRRGQLQAVHADRLRAQLGRVESSTYLADFGMHLALKPFVKSFEYVIAPALCAAGWIDEWTLAVIWASGGSVGRTAYTAARCVQNLLRGRELPLVALWTGVVPVIGNLAFPFQIARSGAEDEDLVAQFLIYDGAALVGRRLPLWGGRDTLTEHACNHVPDRWLSPRR